MWVDKVDSGDRIPNIKPSSGKQKYRYIYSCERSTIWFCVKYITVFPVISTTCNEYSGQAIGILEDSDRIYRIRAWSKSGQNLGRRGKSNTRFRLTDFGELIVTDCEWYNFTLNIFYGFILISIIVLFIISFIFMLLLYHSSFHVW